MSNVWERFNGIADKNEVENAKSTFEPLAEGVYTVRLEEIQPAESKDGLPMIKGTFRMLEGGNRCIFYNQNLQNINYPNMTAVNIAEAVKFISDLVGKDYQFTTLSAFADYITTIPTGTTHKVKLTYGKKDIDKKYPKLKVVPMDDDTDIFKPVDEDSLPF